MPLRATCRPSAPSSKAGRQVGRPHRVVQNLKLARGFVVNADAPALITFLDIGTRMVLKDVPGERRIP
jgi:hypothetical protein